jgi:hypothetical protein
MPVLSHGMHAHVYNATHILRAEAFPADSKWWVLHLVNASCAGKASPWGFPAQGPIYVTGCHDGSVDTGAASQLRVSDCPSYPS